MQEYSPTYGSIPHRLGCPTVDGTAALRREVNCVTDSPDGDQPNSKAITSA